MAKKEFSKSIAVLLVLFVLAALLLAVSMGLAGCGSKPAASSGSSSAFSFRHRA